jgi:hypothetical protein
MSGERIVQLLKGVPGMSANLQHECRAVLSNASEHPRARLLLDTQISPDEQEIFLGPLPILPFDYRYPIQVPGR